MLAIHDYPLFLASSFALHLTPGPDTLYILSRGLGSRRSGVVSVLGVSTGLCFHMLAASAGLSALLLASASAFSAVKWFGAAYLVYLGCQALLKKGKALEARSASDASIGKVYRQGVLTNALNPKVGFFFLAFLPQFVDRAAAHPTIAFLLLGASFFVTATLWGFVLAWGAAAFQRFMGTGTRAARWFDVLTGVTFVGLGLKLAMADDGTR